MQERTQQSIMGILPTPNLLTRTTQELTHAAESIFICWASSSVWNLTQHSPDTQQDHFSANSMFPLWLYGCKCSRASDEPEHLGAAGLLPAPHSPCTLPRTSDLTALNSPSDVRLKSSLGFWSTCNRNKLFLSLTAGKTFFCRLPTQFK